MAFGSTGYSITSAVDAAGPSNPLLKTVTEVRGGWLDNYGQHPWMLIAPLLVYIAAPLAALLTGRRRFFLAFVASGAAIAGVIATAGLSLFPFLLPSSLDRNASLTVWGCVVEPVDADDHAGATVIFLPIVLAYTAWVYSVLRGRVTASDIEDVTAHHY
ncbi:MAG: cytochrome d ubiquinol oxidase subunit II [Bauldia sp.]